MRIFITGGAGFIGSHVAEHLRFDLYHDVMVYDNLSSGKQENLHTSIPLVVADINDPDELEEAIAGFNPDVVLHLAAQPAITTSWINPIHDTRVNILGTMKLLKICKELEIQRVVFASTSAVYQETPEVLFEDYPLFPTTPYGISKMAAERYVRLYNENNIVLRLGNVFGPRQVPLGENQVVPLMIKHFEQGAPFFIHGDGEQRRDFIYVKDVARAFALAITGHPGIYNIASGSTISINDLARCMETIYELPGYNWAHDDVYDPRRNARMNRAAAREGLNWVPKYEFEPALRETIEWWKQFK